MATFADPAGLRECGCSRLWIVSTRITSISSLRISLIPYLDPHTGIWNLAGLGTFSEALLLLKLNPEPGSLLYLPSSYRTIISRRSIGFHILPELVINPLRSDIISLNKSLVLSNSYQVPQFLNLSFPLHRLYCISQQISFHSSSLLVYILKI